MAKSSKPVSTPRADHEVRVLPATHEVRVAHGHKHGRGRGTIRMRDKRNRRAKDRARKELDPTRW